MAIREVDERKFSEFARSDVSQALLHIFKEYGIGFEQLSNMTDGQLAWLFEAIRAKAEKEKEEQDKMNREMEREKRKMRSTPPRTPHYRQRRR